MDARQRNRRNINQADVAVEAAVAIEIAQIRGNAFGVARVVTPHRQRNVALFSDRVGEVHVPLIITAGVLADFFEADEDLGLLTRAIKMQQSAAAGKRVSHREVRAIPARPLIITLVRIHRVPGIKTMRQRDRRPGDVVRRLLAAPDFPGAAQGSAVKLPALIERLPRFSGAQAGGGQPDSSHQRRKPF